MASLAGCFHSNEIVAVGMTDGFRNGIRKDEIRIGPDSGGIRYPPCPISLAIESRTFDMRSKPLAPMKGCSSCSPFALM